MLGTIVDMLAGMTGGIAAVLVGQPLDTVKTNMQLYPNLYKNMFTSLYLTGRQQGVRGLYAGTVPALIANTSENAVMFGSYGRCQSLVAIYSGNCDKSQLSSMNNAAAGSIASLFTSMVLCPTELVKIRMQGYKDFSEDKHKRPSLSLVVKKTLKASGYKGLYRGLGCTILREFVGTSFFFGTYEQSRELLKPNGGRKENCDALATMASGSAAGLVSWLVAYPIDYIKSRVQMSEKKTGWPLVREEIRKVGFRGLYAGLWPTLMKTVPVTGVLLLSVEYSKPIFRSVLSGTPSPNNNPAAAPKNSIFSMCDFISGWSAGIISTFVGHPMDTIRVVQQVTNTSIKESIRSVYNEHKIAGFYRGMLFPIMCTGIVNSVFFGASGNTMRLIRTYRDPEGIDDKDIRYCCDVDKLNKYWHFDTFMAGCVGGFFFTVINIPGEVVKTILQASNIISPSESQTKSDNPNKSESSTKLTSPTKLIVNLYNTGGIRSLYKGGSLLLLRDVPSMGIYLLAYEHFCCMLKKLWEQHTEIKTEEMPKFIQVVGGGLAGVTSWIFVLPLDVIKSKIIVDNMAKNPLYTGPWDCVKKTYVQGGAKIFFRGFWLLCIRAFPVNGITFLVYGIFMDMCGGDGDDKNGTGTNDPLNDDKVIKIVEKFVK